MLAMGYTDALRTLNPQTRDVFTFWDYFRQNFQRNKGIRIDHFLLSPALAPPPASLRGRQNPPRPGQTQRPHPRPAYLGRRLIATGITVL